MDGLTMGLDLAVLATSGAAVLYCGQLGRRLGQLRRAEGGTPEALGRLTRAIEASQASAAQIALAADKATNEMRGAFAELSRQQQAAEDLSGLLDGQSAMAERKVKQAQEAAEAALASVTRRAGIELEALSRAVEIAARANEIEREARRGPKEADPAEPGKAPDAVLPAAHAVVRQRASGEPNPFLRAVG